MDQPNIYGAHSQKTKGRRRRRRREKTHYIYSLATRIEKIKTFFFFKSISAQIIFINTLGLTSADGKQHPNVSAARQTLITENKKKVLITGHPLNKVCVVMIGMEGERERFDITCG